jgi:hypothetical protein
VPIAELETLGVEMEKLSELESIKEEWQLQAEAQDEVRQHNIGQQHLHVNLQNMKCCVAQRLVAAFVRQGSSIGCCVGTKGANVCNTAQVAVWVDACNGSVSASSKTWTVVSK